jgi:parallel beta-helix repeat protein
MSTYHVTSLADSGEGTLRAAIEATNQSPPDESNVIAFTVDGPIVLNSDLPPLKNSVTIDAATAPKYDNAPVVAVDCNGNAGVVFAKGSDWSQLVGLAIYNAKAEGVSLEAGGVTLNGNWIGLDLDGAGSGNGGDGVKVAAGSSNNRIGWNPAASSGFVSNVISGNKGNGVALHGCVGSSLVNNYIGTNADGDSAIPNGGNGIQLTDGSHRNVIGGFAYTDSNTGAQNDPTGNKGATTPVIVVPPLGNLVSGNGRNGILLEAGSQYNILSGNFVGTTADGNSALGNKEDGVRIENANNNRLIGCTFQENPFVYYNVVSGNGANGLRITDSNDTIVHANFFGISANNASPLPNALNGIQADGCSRNVVVGGVIPLGNVCAGNGRNGIEVRDEVSEFITFNTFGGLLAFQGPAPNGHNGLLITATGGKQTVQTNVFSGNLKNGIEISGEAWGVTLVPNFVGLQTNGASAVPNGGNGVEIGGNAHDNVIGGTQASVMPQNTFSGNKGYGVAILGEARNNTVSDSFIGPNVTGMYGLGNQLGGVLIGGSASNNTIGGNSSGNLIGSNLNNGVTLEAGVRDNRIADNSIGFDKGGNPLLPNAAEPIQEMPGGDNTIEGNTGVIPQTWPTDS